MIRKPSPVLLGIISALLIVTPIACTQSQIVKAVQGTVTALEVAQSMIPDAKAIIADVSAINPVLGAQLALLADQGDKLITALIASGNAYLTNPGDSAYQALLNGVNSLLGQADNVLKAVNITNPALLVKAQNWVRLFTTGLHVVDIVLKANAKPNQLKAIPKTTGVAFNEIRPLLDRGYAVSLLDCMGYTGEQVASQAGF